jgi:type II secretory pathway pseudopilin PulG
MIMKRIQPNHTRNTQLVAPHRFSLRAGVERGFMMIELMISMVVLSVGLAGVLVLLITAMYTDKRSSHDTSSTMIAEHILEQITAQGLQADTPLPITDCTGNVLNIATARANLGAGNGGPFGGNGAALTNTGIIDWTQAFGAVPTDPVSGAPYAIEYVACGANGKQVSYDVRWDIIQMPGSANNRLTVIGARPKSSIQLGGLKFVVPVNLRTVD